MGDKPAIPTTTVSRAAFDLLEQFRQEQGFRSMGDAVRYLLKNSPELKTFAKKADLSEEFDLQWGGSRRGGKEESDEN